jgi:hypothetical protein
MKKLFLLLPLFLIACSSAPSESPEEETLAQATDECLANPKLAKSWGECNVKSTIYDRMDVIMGCQTKHGIGKRESIQFLIEVKPNGGVKKVSANKNENKNQLLEDCLKVEIGKMKFASPPKGVKPVINFPYRN